ncbi:MAG: HNH endonuclease [Chlorobiaceae bacterium]|nr:HNH endonuclease [Chlorobiaceae bacterium]
MPLRKSKVLVLSASYEPLSICDAKNAVLLVFGGKAVTVAHHPGLSISTVSEKFPLPSVVRLTVFVHIRFRAVSLNRKNIFLRDGFRCQYCGRKDVPLTIDHVMPKSRGGEDTWENLITACRPCNTSKGNRTPAEAGMAPLKEPGSPSRITFFREHYLPVAESWKPYLYLA